MLDDLLLAHPHRRRHPVEEGEVRPEVEVDEPAQGVPGAPGAGAGAGEVPFGEVDPVIHRLQSEDGKGEEEGEGGEDVDECRHSNILQRSHGDDKAQDFSQTKKTATKPKKKLRNGVEGGVRTALFFAFALPFFLFSEVVGQLWEMVEVINAENVGWKGRCLLWKGWAFGDL